MEFLFKNGYFYSAVFLVLAVSNSYVLAMPFQIDGLKPISLNPIPVSVSPSSNTPPSISENMDSVSISFESALSIYTKAEETRQTVSNVLKDMLERLVSINPEFPTLYCVFKPQEDIETCDTLHLIQDLNLLENVKPVFENVVQYETDSGDSDNELDFIIKEKLISCKELMEGLIDNLQNVLEMDNSGESNTNPLQYDNSGKLARCTSCTTHEDQYYIMYELKLSLGLTVNHSKCIKENLSPNN